MLVLYSCWLNIHQHQMILFSALKISDFETFLWFVNLWVNLNKSFVISRNFLRVCHRSQIITIQPDFNWLIASMFLFQCEPYSHWLRNGLDFRFVLTHTLHLDVLLISNLSFNLAHYLLSFSRKSKLVGLSGRQTNQLTNFCNIIFFDSTSTSSTWPNQSFFKPIMWTIFQPAS